MDRDEILKFCNKYLEVEKFKDFCVNGLQVEGNPKVAKIITGVSLSKQLIETAVKKRAKMIIVHHGIFSKNFGEPPAIEGYMKERLKLLLENNINLCGYHLPLDGHPVIGNNISLMKLLGLKKIAAINSPSFGEIGFLGEYQSAMNFNDFVLLVDEKIGTSSYFIQAGPKKITKVGIIAGSAAADFTVAAKLGADVFLTGSIKESVVRPVEETKINFVNAGHYNTEKFGIQNLGGLIAKKFNIKVEFVDIPCEI